MLLYKYKDTITNIGFINNRGDFMITIKHFIIFKEVANVKSMSKAAENLYISQPTISQKIQEIETFYNIKLFQRYSKSLGISEEGMIFLEHTNKILAEIDSLNSTFFNNKEKVSIKIGTTLTIGTTLAPKLFKSIENEYPNLSLKVYVDNSQSIENLILENKLDIALIEGNTHNDNILKIPIIEDEVALVCSFNHPFKKYKNINVSQLKNSQFIVREKGSATRTKLEKYMKENNIPYTISWECHSWECVKNAILNNHGIALIPTNLIKSEIKNNLINILNLKDCNWNNTFSICYHKNKIWNENLELLKNYISNYNFKN